MVSWKHRGSKQRHCHLDFDYIKQVSKWIGQIVNILRIMSTKIFLLLEKIKRKI